MAKLDLAPNRVVLARWDSDRASALEAAPRLHGAARRFPGDRLLDWPPV